MSMPDYPQSPFPRPICFNVVGDGEHVAIAGMNGEGKFGLAHIKADGKLWCLSYSFFLLNGFSSIIRSLEALSPGCKKEIIQGLGGDLP